MKIENLRKISLEESERIGIKGYVWHARYDRAGWHVNVKAKTFVGLISYLIVIIIKSLTIK